MTSKNFNILEILEFQSAALEDRNYLHWICTCGSANVGM